MDAVVYSNYRSVIIIRLRFQIQTGSDSSENKHVLPQQRCRIALPRADYHFLMHLFVICEGGFEDVSYHYLWRSVECSVQLSQRSNEKGD